MTTTSIGITDLKGTRLFQTRAKTTIRASAAFWRLLAFSLFAVAVASCGGGGGADGVASTPVAPTPGAEAGRVVSLSVRATTSGFTYPVSVYVPPTYDASGASYPTIYVTEADAPYGSPAGSSGYAPGTTPASRFETFRQAMQRKGTQALLIGIGGTARRNTDFLMPTANEYLAFLTNELVPAMERQYRTDPQRRVLSGLSHGGYFVFAALVLESTRARPTFSHYLSTELSFGERQGQLGLLAFERELDTAGVAVPATLLLAGASADGTTNGQMVKALYDQMLGHGHRGLTLHHSQLQTTHVGADVPAFEEALTRYFP